MNRRGWIGSSLLLMTVVGMGVALAAWKHASVEEADAASANQPEPVESVTAAVATEREYRQTTTSIGTVLALRSISLRNELPGTVRQVMLMPGQIVDPGTVLVALDVSKRPVLAVVVNLVLVLVGWRALTILPVQQYPQIQSSSVLITTVYYGASAETVRGFLTTPIERAVSAIGGVDHIESTSRTGLSTVTVRLKLNHDSTAALAEVTARLQQIRSELPEEAEPPGVEIQRADRPYTSFYLSFPPPSGACRPSPIGWCAPCSRSSRRLKASSA
jgi:hypothetical protein